MKPLKIKSQNTHNYFVFVKADSEIDAEWANIFLPKEIEAQIDEKKAVIRIEDYHKIHFSKLQLVEFIIKLCFGIDISEFKKLLVKKYGSEIQTHDIYFGLYKLIEIE